MRKKKVTLKCSNCGKAVRRKPGTLKGKAGVICFLCRHSRGLRKHKQYWK